MHPIMSTIIMSITLSFRVIPAKLEKALPSMVKPPVNAKTIAVNMLRIVTDCVLKPSKRFSVSEISFSAFFSSS